MAIIKRIDSPKCWQRYGEIASHIYYWWEYVCVCVWVYINATDTLENSLAAPQMIQQSTMI